MTRRRIPQNQTDLVFTLKDNLIWSRPSLLTRKPISGIAWRTECETASISRTDSVSISSSTSFGSALSKMYESSALTHPLTLTPTATQKHEARAPRIGSLHYHARPPILEWSVSLWRTEEIQRLHELSLELRPSVFTERFLIAHRVEFRPWRWLSSAFMRIMSLVSYITAAMSNCNLSNRDSSSLVRSFPSPSRVTVVEISHCERSYTKRDETQSIVTMTLSQSSSHHTHVWTFR